MGRDTDRLNIISMNASGRKGKMFADYRRSYLQDVIGNNEPDILFLPGDQPDISSTVLADYSMVQVANNNDTVLLYDTKRLRLNKPDYSSFTLPIGINKNSLVFPMVDILAPPPTQFVVKQFHCVSWHWELTMATSDEKYKRAEWYLMLSQYLAYISGVEVLVGGDFDLPIEVIQKLLQAHNKLVEQDIEFIKPFFRQMGYMDCMTENIHRPIRRLRQLKLHKCQTLVNSSNDTEYFVASKEMQLCETRMIVGSSLPGRCTTMNMTTPAVKEYCPLSTQPAVKEYCPLPTQTHMCIPARPPRHNGG